MSLILEALRKSEAERRRGVAPSVYAELPPSAQTRSKGVPAWLWPLAGVLLLGALWLARGSSTAPPSPAPTSEPVAAAPAPRAATDTQPTLRPVPHLSPLPVPPVATAMAPVATPPHAPPAPVARAPAAVPGSNPMPSANEPPAPRAEDSGTLRLSDLSVEQRKALPALKLSMHMWNEDAAQRFVILDGNRLHEGDRIGDAVVTAITADGVLLDWNGRRLKLPIR